MTTVDHKSNESVESTSSGTDGRRMEVSKIIHLTDFQWQFTQHFHSDLHEILTDYHEQNYETKKKHYTRLLDMIRNYNIDRVEKTTENAKHVETSVLKRLADKLHTNLKVLVTFPSDDVGVEIIGLPEDAERWWILLRKEIDAYKSDLSKKMPQASHVIQAHELDFIKTFYSEVYAYIDGDLRVQKKSEKEFLYAGTFDELDKLKRWIRNHDIDLLENKTEQMPNFVSEEDCKEVHDSMKGQIKLCLSFPMRRMYEVIGFRDDIRSFKDKLTQRGEVNSEKFLAKSAQTANSSRTESDSSHLYVATSSSDREFVFQTPLSSIQVTIARGDLTKQKTEAIVNPCNGLLRHIGGAAKAIANAAGRELLEDCKKYIEKKKFLRTSEVMHSRSGRLNPPIKHVIHASGPVAKEYPDSRKCQDVLENTFFNCFVYANNELHVDSLSVPAISSGTFGVPKDVVAQSAWNALMRFDDQMSKTSKTKCLKLISFINIDQESTNYLSQTFKKHWNMYLLEQKSRVEDAKYEGSRTSSSPLRRSCSFSGPRRSSVKGQESASRDIGKDGTSVQKIKQNHDSEESKSASGVTLQGIPQIKSAGSVVPNSVTESGCCVCLKLKRISFLFTKSNCPHKCCASCMSGKCQRCARSKTASGPPSARTLVHSPTGGKKEKTTERRPDSPDAMLSGNAKTTRTTRQRRSASVGGCGYRATHLDEIDLRRERSENRAMSAATSSITNNQPLQQDDDCCICMDKIDDPKKLDCGHVFCKDCIDTAFKHQPKCPSCSQIFGMLKGNQPDEKVIVKDQKRVCGDTEKVRTSVAKIMQTLDSEESKSAKGATLQGVRPQIKSTGSVIPNSVTEAKCCVCLKSKKISYLYTRRNCPHKCCVSCISGICQQCARGTKIESGLPSASENRAMSAAAASIANSQQHQQDGDCFICMDKIDDPKKLGCGHVFCKDCIDEAFKHQPKCPSCSQIFGTLKGNQPDGKMTFKREKSLYLEGYRGCGAIVITYDIPDGIQTADHPNPGQKFHGTTRTAYLPGNAEGEEVSRMLQKAFDAKLVFTVGKSNTTGRDNVVIWNDINHKTSTGGQYGYPDPTYLQRVTDELAAKGIKSDTARAASPVDRRDTNSAVTSTAGSATGGYDGSAYSHWDDHMAYSSLPVTGAYASPNVHYRDSGAPLSLLTTRAGVSNLFRWRASGNIFQQVSGQHTEDA